MDVNDGPEDQVDQPAADAPIDAGAPTEPEGVSAKARRKASSAKRKASDLRGRAAQIPVKAKLAAAIAREAGPKATARAVAKRLEIEPGLEEAVTRAYHRKQQRTTGYLPARSRGASPGDRPKVSVVVIVYQMSAQAARTLFTLSTSYQRDVSPHEYEVIVVENSSDDNLNPRVAERMGPQFRYYRRVEEGVSPTPAINVGLSLARGDYVALMVDGARMVSPGVLRNALDAFRIQHDAVVAVPGYHIGYDDHMFREDAAHSLRQDRKLIAGIPWRSDGYRLFDISIQSGANPFGFLHPLGESNCMFAPREAYEAIGGADERFDLPGGGMVNLDMYCELLRPESTRLFLTPGEGTFHQFHGGVTTQADSERAALMAEFNRNYAEIRGTTYFAPEKEPYFIGEVPNGALPMLAYSAFEGRSHFEHRMRREQPATPWLDDAVVPAPDILNNPPTAGGRTGDDDVSIYLPSSVRKFEPKHLTFSTWADHIQFGYDLVEAIRPELLVELGTQAGMSYFTFCQSMKENDIEGLCYAVDTWEGEEHTGKYDDSTWELVSNHNRENYPGFSYLMRMFFEDAVAHFEDNTIDLLHIDGLHTYDAVKADFETWYEKVKPGGVILFHDIKARIKDFGVWRFWDEIEGEYPTFYFKHGFGLGVLRKPGGEENTSELMQLMFDSTPGEQAQLRRFYEHAAYFHHVKRRSDKAMEMGLI